MDFQIDYNEKVIVTGKPLLKLRIGTEFKYAEYFWEEDSTDLTFRLILEDELEDADGIELISPLLLNDGSIVDLAGHDASLSFSVPAVPAEE